VATIRAVVFDLDGTLVEFRMDYQSVRKEAIEIINRIDEVPEGFVSSEISIFRMLDKISAYLNGKSNAETIIHNLRRKLSKLADRYEMSAAQATKLIPDAKGVLQEIRAKGFKIGLFTTSGREAMNHVLERFELRDYFDVCIPRDDAPKVKPNPLHLSRVLEILGTRASEALVVGDTTLDIECAKAAGAKSVGVLCGVHNQNQLKAAGADYIIKMLNELPSLIMKINCERT
jgi:HAD superfamily hydrolase (TIGR01509 family)